MSTPVHDDADKQLKRAVPWVSDPQDQEQRDSETRRLQEDVMEAAKRLERSNSLATRSPGEPRTAVGFRSTEPRRSEDRASPEDSAQRIWAELKPQFVSPTAQDGLPRLVIVAGFLCAMAVSALASLVLVNLVYPPAISADASGEDRSAKGNSLAAVTLKDLARVSETQATMTHADEPVAPAETVLASAQPNEIAAPKPPAPAGPQTANLEPAKSETAEPAASLAPVAGPAPAASPAPVASPAPAASSAPAAGPAPAASSAPAVSLAPAATSAPVASPAPAASASPKPQPATSLPQDEIASLLKRGRDLIAAGDIASARLMLTLVAEAGNAEACFTLAGTYDPPVLASMRAIGVQGDPAKARSWYARAAELGSPEARDRLQALR